MTLQIVMGMVAPLVIVAVLLAPRGRFDWRLPVGFGLSVTLAFLVLYGLPGEAWQYVAWVPVAGAVVGVVLSVASSSVWVRAGLHLLLALVVTAIVWPVIKGDPWTVKVCPAVGTFVLAMTLTPLAARRCGAGLPILLSLVVTLAVGVVLRSGFLKLSVPFGSLAAAIGMCGLFGFKRRDLSLAPGAVAVIAPMLVVVPLVAWLYMSSGGGDVPALSFALSAAAILVAWVGEIPLVRRRSTRLAGLLAWVLVLATSGAALGLAFGWGGTSETSEDPLEHVRGHDGLRAVLYSPLPALWGLVADRA